MIYSEAFDEIPEYDRDRIWQRIYGVLTGNDSTGRFARLSAEGEKLLWRWCATPGPGCQLTGVLQRNDRANAICSDGLPVLWLFHFQCSRKENVVLEMNVSMEIAFEFLEAVVQRRITRACVRGRLITARQA
jgi:hypothetical protein